MKKRVLIINHSNPFAKGGGSYASHAYVRAFSDINQGYVDVCLMAENKFPIDDTIKVCNYLYVKQRPLWKRLLSLFTGDIQRYSSFVKSLLTSSSELYGYVVLNGSYEGGALVELCHNFGLKVITIHHNYDPQYAYDNSKGIIYKNILCHYAFKLQKKAYKQSDINLFLTNDDIQLCANAYGNTNAKNYLIGVFEFSEITKLQLDKYENSNITFVITGSLCTVQGVDGIIYFFEQLYPCLPKDCNVIIAGRSPKSIVKDYCSKHSNVTIIDTPENMSEVISSGDVYLCPTRLGGGLKLRVMDGLRLGLPVITHFCSSRGYDAFHGTSYFYHFNNTDEFQIAVDKIIALLKNGHINRNEIYNKYINSFSYKAGKNRLNEILTNEGFTNL